MLFFFSWRTFLVRFSEVFSNVLCNPLWFSKCLLCELVLAEMSTFDARLSSHQTAINIQQPKPAGAVIPASRSSEINPPGHTSLWCSSCCYSYRTQTVITGSTWFAPSCPEITYICILAHSVWCMTNQRCKQKNCARYWTRLHGSEHTRAFLSNRN